MDDKSDKPKKPWIYESPDKGIIVYRRPLGDYNTPREKIRDAGVWLLPEDELENSCTGC